MVQIIEEVVGDFGDRDIVYVELIAPDKEQEKVEGAFEHRDFNFKTHGLGVLGFVRIYVGLQS